MPSKYVSSFTLVDGTCRSSACVAQHRSKAQVRCIAIIVRANQVVRSFIYVRLPKIDPAQRILAARPGFVRGRVDILSSKTVAQRSLDQHGINDLPSASQRQESVD